MAATNSTSANGNALKHQFRQLCTKVAEFGKGSGVTIVPYSTPDLPFFSRLPQEQQKSALEALKNYVTVCDIIAANDIAFQDTPKMIWRAITSMSLRPPSDLFLNLRQGDVIEIHNAHGIQIFRNFEFYEFCGYSIEELYSSPWNELFWHEPTGLHRLIEFSQSVLSGQVKNTISLQWPEHFIEETQSPFKYKIAARFRHGAPLFNKEGAPVAHILIAEGTLLNPHAKPIHITGSAPFLEILNGGG